MDKGRLTIRVGKNTLSFTTTDATNTEQPITYEPYVVKSGVSMAANLREAFKTSDLLATETRRAQVLVDSKPLLVPVERFQESDIETLYHHSFPQSQQNSVTYNVLPDLKAVCLFPINKDLYGVINDRYADVQFIHALTPVWRHMHQRSFTGNFNKLYASFLGGRQLCLFAFQQNRFKFCNTFEATHAHDALYFIIYVWKQLRMDVLHDELHLSGEVPEEELLMQELKQYLQKVYVSNPAAEFSQAPATKVKGMPYDLMTLIVKGR